ncbi:site-specific integrase [Aromatoleum anaerobium]|uniref:Tyrosine-type recombinase/integrase n=1 Tax=Aromatoleum anaerobium TaxID=182180 RepID=A0ABX1PRA0_9RHOO|nr:site-specific integrase [Aromatoleum anaerobium]MCK0505434.1 site-specific integrase [Aromatoleum anaerobium]MCK0507992.1 site-specific integrase [Aromatoleum anaerobium]MCK0508444.1 site-specific integrase [Aromatoleum anaerobium]MCK0509126.1 site-specific integrase [Aromatoleum anaerobium]
MNPLLAVPADFATLLQRFFAERLIQQQNASPRTVVAYRDTFRLLLTYAERERGKPPAKLTLGDFDAALVLDFLAHLETERRNTVRSRNARLAAVRAFAHYVALQCPPALQLAQQILAIPMKRFERPLLEYLSRDEVQAVLAAPDTSTWCGRRDRMMFALLYNTGARVSEMIGIRVADVTLGATSSVRLHGKGRKQRTVPLWKETAAEIRHWLKYADLRTDQPLVPNRSGRAMTRTNVAERLALAITAATTQCPRLAGRRISPHSWRHTTAMHLLQAGVDITVIALWLGHESPVTTHGYVEADLAMKERALDTLAPPETKRKRYRPSDAVLKFLESL